VKFRRRELRAEHRPIHTHNPNFIWVFWELLRYPGIKPHSKPVYAYVRCSE
jgi:hypothetical protein